MIATHLGRIPLHTAHLGRSLLLVNSTTSDNLRPENRTGALCTVGNCVGRQHFEFSGKLREMSERSNVVIRRIWTSWERIIRGALARVPDKRIYAYIPCTRPSFGINRHSRQFWIKGQLRTILANAHHLGYLRKGQLNRHTRYRPATTTRNTATQRSCHSVD